MSEDLCTHRPLFGGAISSTFPLHFQDVSNIRQVPDHQEVFVDLALDESLIFKLIDLKADVTDQGRATWFLFETWLMSKILKEHWYNRCS